jgi:hypothetical protein
VKDLDLPPEDPGRISAHRDNSMCRNGTKVANALDKAKVVRAQRAV